MLSLFLLRVGLRSFLVLLGVGLGLLLLAFIFVYFFQRLGVACNDKHNVMIMNMQSE